MLDETPFCSEVKLHGFATAAVAAVFVISRAVWYAAAGHHDSDGQRTPQWGHDTSARTPRGNDGRPAGAPRHARGARLWCTAGGVKHAADVSGRTTCECHTHAADSCASQQQQPTLCWWLLRGL